MTIIARLAFAVFMVIAATTPKPPWDDMPTRTATGSHLAGDPVNIGFEGSKAEIIAAFAKVGWVVADPLGVKNDARMAEAAVLRKHYYNAPVSHLYLFGRHEDFAVEHENGSIAKRDHARFWDTKKQDSATHLELWIGDASRDISIKILFKRFLHIPVGTTHKIEADVDIERDHILKLLQGAGMVSTVVREPGMGPTKNGVNGGGDRFSTDGMVDIIVLKNALSAGQ
jgi:hypothetical protein